MSNSIVADQSKKFAIRIVKLYKYLCDEKREFVLSKQMLRSGTSVGANVHEAVQAQSRNDFILALNRLVRFNARVNTPQLAALPYCPQAATV